MYRVFILFPGCTGYFIFVMEQGCLFYFRGVQGILFPGCTGYFISGVYRVFILFPGCTGYFISGVYRVFYFRGGAEVGRNFSHNFDITGCECTRVYV